MSLLLDEALMIRSYKTRGFCVGYPVRSLDRGLIMGMSHTSSIGVPFVLGRYFLPLLAVIPLLA